MFDRVTQGVKKKGGGVGERGGATREGKTVKTEEKRVLQLREEVKKSGTVIIFGG